MCNGRDYNDPRCWDCMGKDSNKLPCLDCKGIDKNNCLCKKGKDKLSCKNGGTELKVERELRQVVNTWEIFWWMSQRKMDATQVNKLKKKNLDFVKAMNSIFQEKMLKKSK